MRVSSIRERFRFGLFYGPTVQPLVCYSTLILLMYYDQMVVRAFTCVIDKEKYPKPLTNKWKLIVFKDMIILDIIPMQNDDIMNLSDLIAIPYARESLHLTILLAVGGA
jgi:hypothetical protein